MSFRLACADFTFPLLSHAHALDLVAMLDVEGVDIGLFEGRSHLWPSREFADPRRAGESLHKRVSERGLGVADVFLQMDPDFTVYALNHPDAVRRQAARDRFQQTLEYAAACRCPHVTTLPGVEFDGEEASVSYGRCCDELAWRVEQAQAADIVFGIEAHVGSIAPDPARAQELVTSVPGLTLTLDYTHFTSRGTPDGQIEPLVRYASHFHARGSRPGRLQCSFQDNTIDYGGVLDAMKAAGYSGYIGLEYVWIDWEHCNEVDNVSETVLFRDYFRSRFERSPAG